MDLSLYGAHERKETYFVLVIYVLFFLVAANHYRYKKWHVIAFGIMIVALHICNIPVIWT